MPKIGEIKKAYELGKKTEGKYRNRKYIWSVCEKCGKKRWGELKVRDGEQRRKSCLSCAKVGQRVYRRNGDKYIGRKGYVDIWLTPDDFFFPMARQRENMRGVYGGYVLEHRLAVAKALGRNLHSWEIVHHKHDKYPAGSIEDKQDNRYPENLQLVTDDKHKQITILENKIARLQKQIGILKDKNIRLQQLIKHCLP